MQMISSNLSVIKQNIAAICEKIGRDPQEITLVGVTKYSEAPEVIEAIRAGVTHIGENRVQDARSKFPLIDEAGLSVTKHMIGHLQTNKVKHVLDLFDVIQSVDSLKLAAEIEKQSAARNKQTQILVQINTSGESQKFGSDKALAYQLIEQICAFKHIKIMGLMAMAPFVDDDARVRQCFRDLKIIFDGCAQKYPDHDRMTMKYLSMGMSGDYPKAIEEGANMVRIGSAIFKEQ
ncbi:YggS family pyridoxal phosphate-dependent enzyme [Candidatus Omnitrophota bacterium]